MKTISRSFLMGVLLATLGGFSPLEDSIITSARAASVVGLPDFADLVEKTGAAVVNIRTTERVRFGQGETGGNEDEEMQEFFGSFFWHSIATPAQATAAYAARPPLIASAAG